MIPIFLSSWVIGMSIAAPVGPIGVLCMRRTLVYGWRLGFVSGMGAATADAFYGILAAFGLTALTAVLLDGVIVLQVVGGLFLLWIGWHTLNTKPTTPTSELSDHDEVLSVPRAYGSILVLTLTNPMTILAFLGIFAGMAIGEHWTEKVIVVVGVFAGSLSWWLLLSVGVSVLPVRPHHQLWINRASGMLILLFALRVFWDML